VERAGPRRDGKGDEVTALGTGLVLAGPSLAQNNFGDTESGGLAGPLGLVVIVLLGIATVLLIRNMNRRLRRLPSRFPPQQESDRGLPSAAVSRQDHSHQDQADPGEAIGGEASEARQGATGNTVPHSALPADSPDGERTHQV
jgi:hypothetical protein